MPELRFPLPNSTALVPDLERLPEHLVRLRNIKRETRFADLILYREIDQVLQKIGWQRGIEGKIGIGDAEELRELLVKSFIAIDMARAVVLASADDGVASFE